MKRLSVLPWLNSQSILVVDKEVRFAAAWKYQQSASRGRERTSGRHTATYLPPIFANLALGRRFRETR
jgi:hypothetical protein